MKIGASKENNDIKSKLEDILEMALNKVGIEKAKVSLERPDDISHGDFSSNAALVHAKKSTVNPQELALKIANEFEKAIEESGLGEVVKKVSIAGPGFINVTLKDEYFAKEILNIGEDYGKATEYKGKKIMVEYTDPNPFKEFHIGHLMSNAVGESISRLITFSGAEVMRANWQGDVGPHVAKAIWGALHSAEKNDGSVKFWGKAYAEGAKVYDENEELKKEIDEINRKIYDQSDKVVNELYEKGRKESLEAFEKIYARLDTKFDNYFFEGKEGRNGETIVREFLKKGVFEESRGAIIFPGEKHGVHTRVFITGKGLPTYETKELGLNIEKFKIYHDLDESIIITGNEQNDYFNVLLKAFLLIRPDIAEKTKHISHGMMRLTTGKMGSRKGNVITAEDFIEDAKKLIREKMENRDFDETEKEKISEDVAIGAIKYQILRQAIGGDIIYDPLKSVSFEGDSGPYLDYTAVRAGTVLKKAEEAGIPKKVSILPETVSLLEKLLTRFPEVVLRSRTDYAPHHLTTYLIELAAAFNFYYSENQIIDVKNPLSPYRVALTKAFVNIMKNGLWLLAIKVPERM